MVPRDRFYNAPRYTPYVRQTVNRTVIVNNYRPTTIINNTVIQNFNSDRGRFSAYAGRVERNRTCPPWSAFTPTSGSPASGSGSTARRSPAT